MKSLLGVNVIFSENDTPLDAVFKNDFDFNIFSDRSISGKTTTISCKIYFNEAALAWNRPEEFIQELYLYSISKDYYLYLLSQHKQNTGVNGFLNEWGIGQIRDIERVHAKRQIPLPESILESVVNHNSATKLPKISLSAKATSYFGR